MLYKGIIVEISKTYMVVMDDDTRYVKINRKSNHELGQKIYFTDKDRFVNAQISFFTAFKYK
ncbi:MAG TPA: hypothetical protein DCS67_02510, partial [Clostridiales bacterium UBA8960]|nr:hypothetical protein [Clostridiales bacterium UBA8960]